MKYEFVADHPVLDFVATVAERHGAALESIHTVTDLRTWLVESRLVDELAEPGDEDLDRARGVREACFAMLAARIDRESLPAPALRLVNQAAAGPGVTLIGGTDGSVRRVGDVDAALSSIARDLLDLLGGDDAQLVGWCADPDCTRPFVDRSRGHRRRWCGMRGCGDRAKAAAYRARQRTRT